MSDSQTASYEVLAPGGHANLISDIKEYVSDAITVKPDFDALAPDLTSGASLALVGPTVTEATWAQRETDAVDGVAMVDAILGKTVVWNQLVADDAESAIVTSGHKYFSRIDGTVAIATSDGTAISVTGGTDVVHDLTQMFGAGNEPSTVAEFEALFPEPYYPYDAGSLLSVNLTGIESTGRNLWGGTAMRDSIRSAISQSWDNENAYGRYVAFMAGNAGSKRFYEGPFKENTQYTLIVSACKSNTSSHLNMRFYYTDGTYSNITRTATTNDYSPGFVTVHSTTGKTLAYIGGVNSSGTTYLYYDECCLLEGYVDVSDFMPYAINQHTIPAATYFPDGMRSAGSVHDELTTDAAIVRIGERAYQSGDESDTSVVTDGTTTYYALATPTRTTIDPPLNMSYRVERGGTESVMHTAPTAAPTWRIRYPFDIASAVMSNIAPVEQTVATANHAIGDLLCIGWQLYRATSAIAIGERITAGTNVTATTVAAELAAIQ